MKINDFTCGFRALCKSHLIIIHYLALPAGLSNAMCWKKRFEAVTALEIRDFRRRLHALIAYKTAQPSPTPIGAPASHKSVAGTYRSWSWVDDTRLPACLSVRSSIAVATSNLGRTRFKSCTTSLYNEAGRTCAGLSVAIGLPNSIHLLTAGFDSAVCTGSFYH